MAQPTRKEIGLALGISGPRVHQLIESGLLPRQGTLEEYKEANDRRFAANDEQLDLTVERARLAKAQADAKEMENELTRGELVRFDEVMEQWRAEFARAKSRLLSMPSKLGPLMVGVKTPAEAQSMIETVVWEALSELSQPE